MSLLHQARRCLQFDRLLSALRYLIGKADCLCFICCCVKSKTKVQKAILRDQFWFDTITLLP